MQKLFYQELFLFLRKLASVQAHQKKRHSSEVFLLLKLMKKFEKKQDAKTLETIIQKFYSLNKEKDSLNVESDLLKFFLSKELKRVKTMPKVYRGLPRLFCKKKPAISKIDPLFTDLFSLKEKCLEKTLFTLYAGVKIKEKVEVVCLYENAEEKFFFQSLFQCLKKKCSFIRFSLTPCLKKSSSLDALVIKKDKKVSLRNSCPELIDQVRSADLVIGHFPKNPAIDQLLEKSKKKAATNYHVISGYGELTNNFSTSDISLGLYFLEKGILRLDKSEKKTASNYLCAHTKVEESFFYIKFLLELTKQDRNEIKVVFLLKEPLDLVYEESSAFLEDKKLGKIALEIDHEVVKEKKGDFFGKTLVLSYLSKKTYEEKEDLFARSLEPIGVASDISFSYVTSYQKAFFLCQFDQKSTLLRDLLALARNKLTGYPKAIVYLETLYALQLHFLEKGQQEFVSEEYFHSQNLDSIEDLSKRLKYLILNREVIIGLKVLSTIVCEEFSANLSMVGLFKRAYLHKKHPELKYMEEATVGKYLIGESTFLEMVKSISTLLDTHR